MFGYVFMRKWRDIAKQKTFKIEPPKEFSYGGLKSATRGFHSRRIIRRGSFGTVYKAFFISSRSIAVVKRSRQTHELETYFQAKLSIIASLSHRNLLQLQGWCVERGELLLGYDFMPHGSLEDALYQEYEQCNVLSWSHRRNIVLGVASVLTYLHQDCEQRVMDFKTSNILLDGNLNPRLGYLAPEYLQHGKATEKTDVFSYGVVVLEVACGRRPSENEGQRMTNFVDWVWALHSQGKIIEAADRRLNGEFEKEGMRKLLLLGLTCANPDNAVHFGWTFLSCGW